MMETVSLFSGGEKAAMLLLLMGEDAAAKLAGYFSKDELKQLIDAAQNLPGMNPETMDALVEEFTDNYSTHGLLAGSPELTRILGGKEIPTESAKIPKRAPSQPVIDSQVLQLFFENEPAQIGAILLDRLDEDLTVSVFCNLDPELRNRIFQAYLDNNSMDPNTKEIFETELLQLISETDLDEDEGPDVVKIARLINQFPVETSDNIVSHIEAGDPQIAAAIKKSLFKFAAIPLLTVEDRSILFDGITSEEIVQALAHIDAQHHESFLEVLSPRNRRMVESELSRGQTTVEVGEKAQKLIAIRALNLAQDEKITLPEPE